MDTDAAPGADPAPLGADERAEFEEWLEQRLRNVFGDRRWLIAGEIAQSVIGGAALLRKLGAESVLALAVRRGVGNFDDEVPLLVIADTGSTTDAAPASMMEAIRDANRQLHAVPGAVQGKVDAWDRDGSARAIVEFTIDGGEIAGRQSFGARSHRWQALEDKIAIRDVWAAAGIVTATDRVVSLADANAIAQAHEELASASGTVWAVDNDRGWHGGGTGTHWVPTFERAEEVRRRLAAEHRQVRIQPFLEGVPCSIHAIAVAGQVVAFRPCESIVLNDQRTGTLEYCKTATYWDPPANGRSAMRAAAVAVGRELVDRVDFRGVFTLDGVLTADGFRPTEVNMRYGAALPARITTSTGDTLSLFFTHLAAVEGALDDIDLAALESLVVSAMDRDRRALGFFHTDRAPDEERSVTVAAHFGGGVVGDVREVDTDDPTALARVTWGAIPDGGLAFVAFTDQLPTGPAVAPTLAAVRAFLSGHWDLGLAELHASSDPHPS